VPISIAGPPSAVSRASSSILARHAACSAGFLAGVAVDVADGGIELRDRDRE
jgi:hypothetical protein